MRRFPSMVFLLAIALPVAFLVSAATSTNHPSPLNAERDAAITRAVHWLASVQGHDGGWGQDGGETSYVRKGEHLESNANDVANTAVAVLALLRAGNTPDRGEYRDQVKNGIAFVLANVESSTPEGLAITNVSGTQIQRKLGPFIDTFLTSMLLSEVDGTLSSKETNARVHKALTRCVSKIESNQLKDGSWNISGGWAPVLGTSMAARSLYVAQQKGVTVSGTSMERIEMYTMASAKTATGVGAASGGGSGGGVYGCCRMAGSAGGVIGAVGSGTPVAAPPPAAAVAASAGVPLYQRAQELEQLSRDEKSRAKNKDAIKKITDQIGDVNFVRGFGSVGGEEYFSYLNISDSLHRSGGEPWTKWNRKISDQILASQNADGTWAGSHCITGRVAVTSAAILTLLVDRNPVK